MKKSYHIFYFPFIVNKGCRADFDEVFKYINSLSNESIWKRWTLKEKEEQNIEKKEERDRISYYNERMYFHHFVHNALYDSGYDLFSTTYKKNMLDKYSLVLHYKIKDSLLKYVINVEDVIGKKYVLDIDKITLDYYFTNVAILSFYVKNEKYTSPNDILSINYYGREFLKLNYENTSNSIDGGNIFIDIDSKKSNNYCNKFRSLCINNSEKKNVYVLNDSIECLLNAFFRSKGVDVSEVEYIPVFDSKMFVNCIYLNDELSYKYKKLSLEKVRDDIFWQNFVEIDLGCDLGCQNMEMRETLTKNNTYFRWQDLGTLYGITDRSFVCLSSESDFSNNRLVKDMQETYAQMIKLVLIQRASLLAFSEKISRINLNTSNIDASNVINKIYKNYILYIKKLYFVDVTSQIQGKELYEMLHKTFHIKSHIERFDDELSKMNLYLTALKDSDKRDSQNNLFNLMGGIFLPATLISGILGMNDMLKEDNVIHIMQIPITKYIINDLCIVIVVSLCFWGLMLIFNKTIRKIVFENKLVSLFVFVCCVVFLILYFNKYNK